MCPAPSQHPGQGGSFSCRSAEPRPAISCLCKARALGGCGRGPFRYWCLATVAGQEFTPSWLFYWSIPFCGQSRSCCMQGACPSRHSGVQWRPAPGATLAAATWQCLRFLCSSCISAGWDLLPDGLFPFLPTASPFQKPSCCWESKRLPELVPHWAEEGGLLKGQLSRGCFLASSWLHAWLSEQSLKEPQLRTQWRTDKRTGR